MSQARVLVSEDKDDDDDSSEADGNGETGTEDNQCNGGKWSHKSTQRGLNLPLSDEKYGEYALDRGASGE